MKPIEHPKPYHDLTSIQDIFLTRVLSDENFYIGTGTLYRVNVIQKLLMYREQDKSMLNKIGTRYKKYLYGSKN